MVKKTGGKSLPTEERDRVVGMLREIRDAYFDGSVSKMAKAFGMAQPTISEVLNGNAGPGQKLLKAMSKYTTQPLIQIGDAIVEPIDPALASAFQMGSWPQDAKEAARSNRQYVGAWTKEQWVDFLNGFVTLSAMVESRATPPPRVSAQEREYEKRRAVAKRTKK